MFFYNSNRFLNQTYYLTFSVPIYHLLLQFSRKKLRGFLLINCLVHFLFILNLICYCNLYICNGYYRIIDYGNIHSIILSILIYDICNLCCHHPMFQIVFKLNYHFFVRYLWDNHIQDSHKTKNLIIII